MNVRHVIWASIVSTTISCQSVKKEYNSFDEYPVREDALTEMEYSPAETKFSLWAPTAEEVRVLSLIHISEPTRPRLISYAVFCL